MSEACARRDLAARKVRWLLWRVPLALLVIGIFVGPFPRMLLWTPAFLVAGAACVVNAIRCGRLHCYITGPLYLLAALASVLVGMELMPFGWTWIGIGAVGGSVLAHVPEWVRGKYLAKS